jgi:hypothetical protein
MGEKGEILSAFHARNRIKEFVASLLRADTWAEGKHKRKTEESRICFNTVLYMNFWSVLS